MRVLAEESRLALLPEIRAQFEALKNEHEGVLEAEVHAAFELSAAQLADLAQRLEKKTGRKVQAKCSVDKDLIAGVRSSSATRSSTARRARSSARSRPR